MIEAGKATKRTAVVAVNQMSDAQELNTKQGEETGNLPPLVEAVDRGSEDGPGA